MKRRLLALSILLLLAAAPALAAPTDNAAGAPTPTRSVSDRLEDRSARSWRRACSSRSRW